MIMEDDFTYKTETELQINHKKRLKPLHESFPSCC